MERSQKIFVAGHRGMVGRAIVQRLGAAEFVNLIMCDRAALDLHNEQRVAEFFARAKPDVVILAAAKVGGIKANVDHPVEFLLENLSIQNSVIRAAHEHQVRKLLFLASAAVYPRNSPQPIPEGALLSGPLESTVESYALAKIAGIKLCQAFSREHGTNFISIIPANLYGPNDNFNPERSHVLAALLRRAHEAKVSKAHELVVWGTGDARREFLHVDDLASACLFLLENYDSPEIINVGCGEDISIRELAELICDIVGFNGNLVFDTTEPDGAPRKVLDVARVTNLGWRATIRLREGIAQTYAWFSKQYSTGNGV